VGLEIVLAMIFSAGDLVVGLVSRTVSTGAVIDRVVSSTGSIGAGVGE